LLKRQWVGNDIVDLKDPQAQGKAHNERFLARICADVELPLVTQAKFPHVALWTLWSIKEASYKVVQKCLPAAKAIPNQFVCQEGENGVWDCRYQEMRCRVRVAVNDDFVHAVACLADGIIHWDNVVVKTDELLTGGNPSEAVRQLAVHLLREKGYQDCSIVRRKELQRILPPQIYQGGIPLPNSDISLSHDGRFVAVALWLKPPRGV